MMLTAVERARTILATSGDVQVSLIGTTSHVVTPDGSLLLLAPARASGLFGVASRLAADLVTVEATDVVSVPQPDRVRGRLRLLGSLDTRGGPWSGDVVDYLRGPEPGPVEPIEPVEVVRFVPTGVSLDWPRQERWVGVDLDSYRWQTPTRSPTSSTPGCPTSSRAMRRCSVPSRRAPARDSPRRWASTRWASTATA